MTNKITFNELVKQAKEDPGIVGLILSGSRGKGFEREDSDYDVHLIVKANARKSLMRKYRAEALEEVDLGIMTLNEFRVYAKWDSAEMWDRYDFAHAKLVVDKTKVLRKLVGEKGLIPKKKQKMFIERSLDAYTNSVYRAVKAHKRGNMFGAHLESSLSMSSLLDALFALNGRHRPFISYLAYELEKYPLKIFPWSVKTFLNNISKIILKGDVKAQQQLFKEIKKLFISRGFKKIYDAWEGKDDWAANRKLKG